MGLKLRLFVTPCFLRTPNFENVKGMRLNLRCFDRKLNTNVQKLWYQHLIIRVVQYAIVVNNR